jgi:hypothetical protein
MIRVLLIAALLVSPAFAGAVTPPPQAEVLVLASAAVRVDAGMPNRRWIEIQNLGPNAISCAFSAAGAVVTKARRLAQYEVWTPAVSSVMKVYCRAATADQVTGAATIVSELP